MTLMRNPFEEICFFKKTSVNNDVKSSGFLLIFKEKINEKRCR